MVMKRTVSGKKNKGVKGKSALAGRSRARVQRKGGSVIMATKKAINEKKQDVMEKTKALFRTGKERFQEVDLGPIWKRVKKGVESTAQVVGKGSDSMRQKFGGTSEVMEKGAKKMKTGLGSAVDAVGRGAERVTVRALSLAKRAGVQYRIAEQNRKLQVLLAELGGRVYDITKRNPQALNSTDPDIMKMVGRIRDAEKALVALEEKSGALKK